MRLSRQFWTLSASHIIPDHPGRDRKLHGHNWKIEVEFEGSVNPETGMVADFSKLKTAVQPIFSRLNHQHLNYYMLLPTPENFCFYLAHELYFKAAGYGARLIRVSVWDTENTAATWTEKDLDELIHSPEPHGWDAPYKDIPVFSSEQEMLRTVLAARKSLEEKYRELVEIGGQLAAFERYHASLDEKAAKRLHRMLAEMKDGLHTLPDGAQKGTD